MMSEERIKILLNNISVAILKTREYDNTIDHVYINVIIIARR